MNCHKVQSLISAYVDCELSGMEMLAVRQHLSACNECNSEFDSLLQVKKALGGLCAKHPADSLAGRICMRLDHVEPPVPVYRQILANIGTHLPSYHPRLGWAAACLGLFAMLMVFRGGQIAPPINFVDPADPGYVNSGSLVEMPEVRIISPEPRVVPTSFGTPPKSEERPNWMSPQEPKDPTFGGLTLVSLR